MAEQATKQKSEASQEFVPVKEVRNGIIMLKDGGIASVLLASSLNFALKSGDEQEATLLQFQNFLNSLDFSVQFYVQSRKLDIRPYLALLDERLHAQTEDLMKIQVKEYIEFVRNFTEQANIMSKNFFIVIPYTPAIVDITKGVKEKLLGGQNLSAEEQKTAGFEESRTQLEQRVSVVEQGLIRCGIRTALLGTEEIIELLYKMFNPGELEKPIKLT